MSFARWLFWGFASESRSELSKARMVGGGRYSLMVECVLSTHTVLGSIP